MNSDPDPKKVDLIFSEFHDNVPGCAVGVNQSGELIFAKGYGAANLDYGIPLSPQSRLMIASISKQFAAAALFMLEQEELLSLDEDLRSHIPEISQFEWPVTARQLIHHTSGIRDIYNLLSIADIGLDQTITPEQALEMLSKQKQLNFEPGSRHIYSNMAYFLMSVVVEKFSGMTLREYTRKHFFDPAGMDATHWHDNTEMIVPNRAYSYLPTGDGPGLFYRGNMARVGARGLFTTIEDFAKWDRNYLDNKTNLEQFREKMLKPGSTITADSINYAGGLRLGNYKTLPTFGHGGNYMGLRSHYMHFPDTELSVFVFCNMSNINPSEYAFKVADLFLRDTFDEVFTKYTGTYRNIALNADFELTTKEGSLYLNRSFEEPRELSWSSEDRFSAGNWTVRFHRNSDNNIDKLTVETPRTGRVSFERQSE